MMTIAPGSPLRGTVTLPGDKSISHRAALFAALAHGTSVFENFLVAGVTRVMLNALTALGVAWQLDGTTLTVQGNGITGLRPPAAAIDCGNSATTMRLLAGAVAAAGIPAVLDGSPGLRRRPMDRIVEPLQHMGVPVRATRGRAPLVFESAGGRGGEPEHTPHPAPSTPPPRVIHLPVASAQVKSCLLLAGLAADAPLTIIEPGPSRDHSERMLASMGVEVENQEWGSESRELGTGNWEWETENGEAGSGKREYRTAMRPPGGKLRPLQMTIPGDISAAAFLIVAALITPGSDIRIQNVGLNPTRTGLLDVLQSMGARIETSHCRTAHNEPVGDLRVRHSLLHGTIVSGPLVVRMIDEFPVFAVAAAHAYGPTAVRGARELRYKESDRISALCQQLRGVGIEVEERPDGFILPGNTPPRGGAVDPHGDHRLAMSLAVAGLAAQSPISITHPDIIHESFPGFRHTLEFLGARID